MAKSARLISGTSAAYRADTPTPMLSIVLAEPVTFSSPGKWWRINASATGRLTMVKSALPLATMDSALSTEPADTRRIFGTLWRKIAVSVSLAGSATVLPESSDNAATVNASLRPTITSGVASMGCVSANPAGRAS